MSKIADAPLPVASQVETEHVALDEDYALTANFVEKVVDASDSGDGLKLRSLLEDLHPADVADLMGFLTAEHRAVVLLWIPPDLLAETLPELDDNIREEVLERVPHLTLAEALQELDSDDAAAVVEDLEDVQREKVLPAHRAGLKTVLLPEKNLKDLVDLPKAARSELKIIPVKHMDDVLKLSLAERQ